MIIYHCDNSNELLQGVKTTIEHLIEGGIIVWVLTGDKLETAQSIGYSCGLIDPFTPILVYFKFYLKNLKIFI